MPTRMKGILLTALSAVIYGSMPTLGLITYGMGSNPINLTFTIAVLALPLLAVLGKKQGGSLRLTRRQVLPVLAMSLLSGMTTILLNSSYLFISVGLATTIHFVYPLLVALYGALFRRERLARWQVVGMLCGMTGILLFLDDTTTVALGGMAIALTSGFTFAGYILMGAREDISEIPTFKLSFYIVLVSALISMIYGLGTDQIVLSLPPIAWILCLIISWSVMVGAVVLLQTGVRLASATDASFFSLLEPITSIVCGILFLGDSLPLMKGVGCLCILGGLVLFVLAGQKNEKA